MACGRSKVWRRGDGDRNDVVLRVMRGADGPKLETVRVNRGRRSCAVSFWGGGGRWNFRAATAAGG